MTTTRIIFVGPASVGKTSIVGTLNERPISLYTPSTIGSAFSLIRKGDAKFEIWDTAGQERYMSMCPMYFNRAHIVIFVFDVSEPRTIQQLLDYVKLFFEYHRTDQPMPQFIFIGNKVDRDHVDVKSLTEQFLRNRLIYENGLNDAPFLYISALDNTGIDELWDLLKEYASHQVSDPARLTVSLQEAEEAQSFNCYTTSSYYFGKC